MSTGGQVVGGVVGAVVGFFAGGGPQGALYGAQIGIMAGGYLDPTKGPTVNGPRLTDLTVQTSTYGAVIPRVYGTCTVNGNVIWLQGNALTETVTKKKSGGKGGGSKTTTRTYTYSASFAVGLCEGPIIGVRRIWVGPDLIYDAGSSDPDTVAASNAAAEGFAIYLGTDTQAPDHRIQADVGVANCPAWRGLAYIVFYDLALARYSNSLMGAQVRVEVMKKGNVPADYSYSTGYAAYGFTVSAPQVAFGAGLFVLFQHTSLTSYYTSPTGVAWTSRTRPSTAMGKLAFCKDRFFAGDANAFYTSTDGLSWSGPSTTGHSGAVNQWAANASRYAALLASGPTVIWSSDSSTWNAATLPGASAYDSLAWNGSLWAAISSASGQIATSPDLMTWTLVQTVSTGWSQMVAKGSEFVAKQSIAQAMVLHSPDGSAWTQYATAQNVVSPLISFGDEVFFIDAHSEGYTSGLGQTTWALDLTGLGAFSTAWRGLAWNGSDRIVTTKATVDDKYLIARTLDTPGASAVTYLSEIVASECLASALLTAGDIDVTSLTSQVRGYRIGSIGAIRSAIEPLQAAWPFDVRQHGYKITFVARGGASVVTVPAADLDARAGGSAPGVQITVGREMDSQLPRRVTVQHLDYDREYDAGTQYAERLNTAAINASVLDLPIVMTSAEAAGKAEVLLYLYWLERHDVTISLPPTYNQLEPGDVLTLTTPEGAVSLRLTGVTNTSDGRVECQAKYANPAIYTPAALGASPAVTGITTVNPIGASVYHLLDVPYMSSAQSGPSFLAAMTGAKTGWRGGVLMRSADAGATWDNLQDFDPPGAAIGACTNSLGVVDSRMIDAGSVLSVTLTYGDLFSVTQLAMLGGENHFAYGADGRWEIIAAQTCTLVTGKSYTLQNLLRGRFGTEWAMGLHAAGDALILLDPSDVLAITVSSGAIGLSSLYRGVTVDRDISTDTNRAFTYQAVNLKPLSPVFLSGNRDVASNDWSFSWIRRTRTGGEWRDYVDAELGESSEQYHVEIYADGTYATVKRTLVTTIPAADYPSADEVADFGANQSTHYLKIYQLSATVGRGYPLTSSITR